MTKCANAGKGVVMFLLFILHWMYRQLTAAGLTQGLLVVDMDNGDSGWVQSNAIYAVDDQLYLDGGFVVCAEKDRLMDTYISKGLYGWQVRLPIVIEDLVVRDSHVSYPCEIYLL